MIGINDVNDRNYIKTAPLDYEKKLHSQGYAKIGGLDEVGRGPLAGPVMACVVIMPRGLIIPGVNDSKKIPPKKRETLAALIKESAIDYAIGIADVHLIDEINILQATFVAMAQALDNLKHQPDALLIDGLKGKWQPAMHHEFIKGGDSASHSISCASIIAKTERDALMMKMHEKYPEYGFDTHKGYGTAKHIEALQTFGICPIHRRSFLKKVLT